jgi:hypothetical protein
MRVGAGAFLKGLLLAAVLGAGSTASASAVPMRHCQGGPACDARRGEQLATAEFEVESGVRSGHHRSARFGGPMRQRPSGGGWLAGKPGAMRHPLYTARIATNKCNPSLWVTVGHFKIEQAGTPQ